MVKSKDLNILYLLLVLTTFLYFYIRIGFQESVFFDFDMPRVALIVQDFLKHGTFLTSQSYMQESVWLNIPWGPALIYFYSLFIKISSDPIDVSIMLTFFHFIGIVVLVKLGWKYFSPTVGALAGLLMATNPYWVTYSRIIYQPAPVITLIIISMYLFFSVIKDKNKLSNMLLPLSWAVLFQIYIPTYSFIIVSLLFLVSNYKSIKYPYFFIGVFLSFVLYIPTLKFYLDNPTYIQRFFDAPSLFTPPEKTFLERLTKVALTFIQIPLGGKFIWQTGYAYSDFVAYFPIVKYDSPLLSGVFLFSLFSKKFNQSKLIVLFWTLSSFVSLLTLWVTDLVPRYFLISIPPAMLLISVTLNDLIVRFKNSAVVKYALISLALLISLYWSAFNIKYDNFVRDYNYPNGRMYDVAETPYLHFKKAMDYVQNQAVVDGCNSYVLSNDHNDLNYSFWLETRYLWDHIYKNSYVDPNQVDNNCRYLLTYEFVTKELGISEYQKFGPFVVFKYIKN